MIIRNLAVQNPKISFENLNFDFSEYGTYIIRGENGVGKTTILEKIIFGRYDVLFSNEEQYACYINNRHNLFSYVPQNIPICKVSVIDFLIKGNQDVSQQEIKDYMHEFGISDITLNERFDRLSGGEKVKLFIMSALLKDTPYIFLDEPTNHLDDASVQILENIIQRKSTKCTFIIVCHDIRFNPKFNNLIQIDSTGVNVDIKSDKSKDKTNKNTNNCKHSKNTYTKFAKGLLMNLINLLVFYVFIAVIVFLISFNALEFMSGYSIWNTTNDPNIIGTYVAEGIYTRTNMVYAKAKNLHVQEQDHERLITYADIEDIYSINGVDRVILFNASELYNIYYQESRPGEPILFSVPHDFVMNFRHIYLGDELFELAIGSYPTDNANQIALSMDTAINYFMLDIDNAINQTIEYDNTIYVISGILNNNSSLSMVSHMAADQSIFYEYNKSTFRDYLTSRGIGDEEECYIYIYTAPGKEESVLNQIFTSYPAHNYSSYEYALSWQKQYNKDFIRKNIMPINILMALCLSIVVFFLRKHQITLDQSMLVDYGNYYIDRSTPVKIYFSIFVSTLAFISLIAMIGNYIYSPLVAHASSGILILDVLIAFLPSLLYSYWRIRHAY